MDLPHSLPARVYLLTYDHERGKLTQRHRLNYLVRAAALEDLTLRGKLLEEGGRVRVVDPEPTGDPVLDSVLTQVADSAPRRWRHWIRTKGPAARAAVRDYLEAGGWVAVERRTILGVFPRDRVTVRDHRGAKDLTVSVARTITGSRPVAQLDPRDAALAALAAYAELNTVCSGKLRRLNRDRIARLRERAGPAVREFKKVLDADAAAATSV